MSKGLSGDGVSFCAHAVEKGEISVNSYRANPNAWRGERGRAGGTADLWSSFTQFASRQPELVIAGALIGGALVAFLIRGAGTQSSEQGQGQRRMAHNRDASPHRMPSTRLGATEDQMSDNFVTPSSHALEAGSGGTTGAIYDLDPDSLTSG